MKQTFMWIKKSKLNLWSLTFNSSDEKEVISELIKRLKAEPISIFPSKNRWIKSLQLASKKNDKEKREKHINKVLKRIYDYGDANRIWVS